MRTFQQLILRLDAFWDRQGCVLLQPYDMEVGAGTFHPATFMRAIGPEPWRAAYVQPSPDDIQEIYLESLREIGVNPREHDIRFVEDDWESPTLGAWGLGWEVWLDGMEVTQFTYFQQCGGIDCKPVAVELTYGLERLAMYLQGVNNVYDLTWAPGVRYGDVHHRQEVEGSTYNFKESDPEM